MTAPDPLDHGGELGPPTAGDEVRSAPARRDFARRMALLEGRLEVLSEALRPKRKTAFELAKDYAGFAALVISLTTGLFTLWRVTVQEPAARASEHLAAFQQAVRDLSELDSDLALKLSKARNSDERATFAGVASATRASLLARAEALLPSVQKAVSPTEYLVLSLAAGNAYQFVQSRRYAKSALDLSSTPLERAESLKQIARADFSTGNADDIAEGEDAMNQALDLIGPQPEDRGLFLKRLDLLGAYVIFEATTGRCELVSSLFAAFEAEISSGKLNEEESNAWRSLLREQFARLARCEAPAGL